MKAGVIFTGNGPILVLTSYQSFTDPRFVDKLRNKGIAKYIACGVDVELCRARYAQSFDIIQNDLHQDDDLRILDYNGFSVFNVFRFSELSPPVYVEPESTD